MAQAETITKQLSTTWKQRDETDICVYDKLLFISGILFVLPFYFLVIQPPK